jgi:hypothetical protein
MTIQTRKPTGKPPWPIVLLAGAEKVGKSYESAKASASDLIARSFWIGVGEDDPDEYGAIPGARFEIVPHNGTYASILSKLEEAKAEPRIDGKPNLIVLDSGTRMWELLSDEAQARANARRKGSNGEAVIGHDLWNRASGRWYDLLDVLREHDGPSIITARLDVVTVMDADGKPTKDKTFKVKAQKSLPYDVGVVVEMPARGETYIGGVRSLKLDVPVGEKKPVKEFSVDWLWRALGVDGADATSPRQHSEADGQASAAIPDDTPAQRPPGNPNEDAGAAALHARQAAARAAAPVWGDEQAEQLEVRIYEAKGNVDILRSLWKSAQGMGAPQAVLDRIANINKPQTTETKEQAA